jgi:hypothetical protein
MDLFGCCSSYKECSDNNKCLHISEDEYKGCSYRKNLESGKIFYGKNSGKIINFSAAPTKLYVYCYNRAFIVSSKNANGFTYSLDQETIKKLIDFFTEKEIPYKTEILEDDCISDGKDEDPANSQVIFEAFEQNFAVKNFNAWLIKNKYAAGIVKALSKREIKAKIELTGKKYCVPVRYEEINISKIEEKPKEKTYLQSSLFQSA